MANYTGIIGRVLNFRLIFGLDISWRKLYKIRAPVNAYIIGFNRGLSSLVLSFLCYVCMLCKVTILLGSC